MSQSNSRSRSYRSAENSTLLSDNDTLNNTSFDVDSSSTLLMSSGTLSTTNAESDTENRVTKAMIEKKQLLHDMELLKIEVSQKNLMIDNLKIEHMNKVDELEEKVAENRHAKLILQTRLESQLRLQQQEYQGRLDRMKQEWKAISTRQQQLESENERLQEKAGDLRQELLNIQDLSQDRYLELKTANPDQVSLKDFVMVKIYEAAHPYKTEIESLHQQVDVLTRQLLSKEEDAATYQKEAEEERIARSELECRAQRLAMQVDDLKSKLEQGDYKKSNFDNVRGERDNLDREVMELRKTNTVLDASLKAKVDELQEYQKEMTSTKQLLALLKQDKEYLNKQVQELSTRCTMAEDQLHQTTKQLDNAKQAREDLYEKYITTREQYKSEYEIKLREELDSIGVKTNTELDKIRIDTRDMYERENKSLREARDNALHEKNRAQNAEKEVTARYDQLLAEFRQLQVSTDSKLSEQQNELKLKQFEMDRLQIVHDEKAHNFKQLKLDYEKCNKKNEVLTHEFYVLQNKSEKQISSMETEIREKTDKLKTYEKLEQELDDVIMQTAEIENEVDAEKFLCSYGYGANVPSTAKRRMQQSVHLAKRVLQLERANTSLRNELEREKRKRDELEEELTGAETLLNEAKQPYRYQIESIKRREDQIQTLEEELASLKEDYKVLKQQKDEMAKTKNLMSADLERLLNIREEKAHLQQYLLSMDPSTVKQHSLPPRTQHRIPTAKTSDINIVTPQPTVFTKSEAPKWYRKLKKKLGEPVDED